MTKLTKAQLKAHESAVALLKKETLTLDDKWEIYTNWHEGMAGDITHAAAFFTPLSMAMDFAFDAMGETIVDLCAGIGVLAFAVTHRRRYYGPPPKITCIETNPAYVAVGKKLLPEATWINANVGDIWREIGHFDCAISNPPFGRTGGAKLEAPHYNGADFEYKIIDIAAEIASFGAFIIPQGSAPFRYSGVQCYDRVEPQKFRKFRDQTGIDMEFGVGVDTTFHKDDWKTPAPVTEIATCDFASLCRPGQMELFGT